MPYAGLHRLLMPLLGGTERLPETQRRALFTAIGIEDGPAPQIFLVALAALTLLTERAEARPVVAVIDDIQWLDACQQRDVGIRRPPRHLGPGPRRGRAPPRSRRSRGGRAASSREMELFGLDDDAARALLLKTAGDLGAPDRELILQQASGNPLALVELPGVRRNTDWNGNRTTYLPLSARLERAFASRLTELPATTRDALLVAAVDAQDELGEILEATARLTGHDVSAAALDPAVDVGLLTFDARRVAFRHPLGAVRHRAGRNHVAPTAGSLRTSRRPGRPAVPANLASVLGHHGARRRGGRRARSHLRREPQTWLGQRRHHRSRAVGRADDRLCASRPEAAPGRGGRLRARSRRPGGPTGLRSRAHLAGRTRSSTGRVAAGDLQRRDPRRCRSGDGAVCRGRALGGVRRDRPRAQPAPGCGTALLVGQHRPRGHGTSCLGHPEPDRDPARTPDTSRL